MTDTPLLRLPFIEAAQSQKHVTHNEALAILDALVQLSVLQADAASPPASPAQGARYLVGTGATGAFAGHDGEVASWQDNAWRFLAPRAGWRVYVEDSDAFVIFDGASWQDISASIRQLQNLERLGVGAQADAQNPFSAKLNTALMSARYTGEGGNGDLRTVFNKEAASGVVSQLFQTNFSGRAEAGLIGTDDFSIKVSADGAAWLEAMRIDRNSGVVNFPAGVTGAPGLAVKRVEIFTASGTFVKQAGDALFHVELVGGGGGGSGARSAPGSACGGGSGGNGGSPVIAWITADQLGVNTPVTIGAGGAGGAPAPDNSNGSNGTPGGTTNFGSILTASGGREGNSGKTTSGGAASNHLPGYPDNDYPRSGAGGFAAAGGIPSRSGIGTSAAGLSGPGGGGGGLSASNASFAGGAGSSAGYAWLAYRGSIPPGGAAEGGSGSPGASVSDPRGLFGGGGAGGGAAHATSSGNGGEGGTFGAGGGGGGAGRNGFSGGAGGNGSPGKAIIVVLG